MPTQCISKNAEKIHALHDRYHAIPECIERVYERPKPGRVMQNTQKIQLWYKKKSASVLEIAM